MTKAVEGESAKSEGEVEGGRGEKDRGGGEGQLRCRAEGRGEERCGGIKVVMLLKVSS